MFGSKIPRTAQSRNVNRFHLYAPVRLTKVKQTVAAAFVVRAAQAVKVAERRENWHSEHFKSKYRKTIIC